MIQAQNPTMWNDLHVFREVDKNNIPSGWGVIGRWIGYSLLAADSILVAYITSQQGGSAQEVVVAAAVRGGINFGAGYTGATIGAIGGPWGAFAGFVIGAVIANYATTQDIDGRTIEEYINIVINARIDKSSQGAGAIKITTYSTGISVFAKVSDGFGKVFKIFGG